MKNIKTTKYDRRLFFAVMLLTIFGYIMVISAHANVWITYGAGVFAFEIAKITVFLLVGFVLMNRIRVIFDLGRVMKSIKIIFFIVALMMLATLLFPAQYGAQAWIRIPGMTLQPVEFLKITLILYFAYHFGRFYQTKAKVSQIIRAPLVVLIISFGFVFFIQNDLGSAMILAIIALCIYLAIPEKKYNSSKLIICLGIVAVIVLFYIFGSQLSDWIYQLPNDYPFKAQLLRIAILFNPLHDVYNSGYQLTNSLVALVQSGPFGMGFGNSDTKFLVPEPYNDAILAVIAEETGLIGIGLVFGLYIYIISRLLSYAKMSKILIYDRLILIGIASFFMAQFFVNVGGMVGLIPMTGVTLLFISSGGSSIITAFITIGIAQGVIKRYIK
ncbi:FtsW/RodA/SpoVE family cell cycle protein [Erysipelotrichaceae bacterium OttesenSCG-928-M19]|nr:FtsW/RodA/SpoVE family cell cycle protein [Erysipelotrichaceae bacterium OttesenSCG-928-M19]